MHSRTEAGGWSFHPCNRTGVLRFTPHRKKNPGDFERKKHIRFGGEVDENVGVLKTRLYFWSNLVVRAPEIDVYIRVRHGVEASELSSRADLNLPLVLRCESESLAREARRKKFPIFEAVK